MDIVKEVESALEEEGYVKIDSTSPSTMSNVSSSVSSADKTSSLSGVTSAHSQPVDRIATSPVQQNIRPDPSSTLSENTSSSKSSANVSSSSSSSSTWQGQNSGQDREEEQTGGVWGWMSSAVSVGLQTTQNIGRNIVEKTKTSVESVITTLDPEMEDYMYGRDQSVSLAVTSTDTEAIEAIKDGFLQVFEHVVVQSHSSVSGIAPLPVGFSAGVKGAQHRIANLIRGKKAQEGQVIIGVEEMVSELLPGKWFGLTCLALNDPTSKLELETFSQSIHIPKVYITKAEESTPSNYNLRWSGLSFTLGEVIIGSGQAHGDWHSKISGSSKRQILTLTARTLAGQFRDKLKASADSLLENALVM